MKYVEILEKLQKENEKHIVLMKNGIFFIAIGKDALELNKLLGLKLTCMRKGLCKVGFQAKNVEKYIIKLKEKHTSFVIYIYNKETATPEKIFEYTENPVTETRKCNNCNTCQKREESEEEIIERVRKLGTTN